MGDKIHGEVKIVMLNKLKPQMRIRQKLKTDIGEENRSRMKKEIYPPGGGGAKTKRERGETALTFLRIWQSVNSSFPF